MASFSIPADFQTSTIERIAEKNKQWDMPITDVYGTLNPSIFGSGRITGVLRQINFDSLNKYVDACNRNDVSFNYALNFLCSSNMEYTEKGKKEIIKFLQKLSSIGVKRFTVVLPSVIELLRASVPDAKISVSVISNVDSLSRLKVFLSSKNVERIMLPESMNRKVGRLEKLIRQGKEVGVEFGTIVNGICLIDCPFREFHYSVNSHSVAGTNFKPVDYYGSRCAVIKLENPAEVLKMPWIRPEDIKRYVDFGITIFKVAGREMHKADFLKVVDIYNKGSYDGNLWEFLRCFSTPPHNEPLNYSKMFDLQNKSLGQFTQRFFESKSFCTTKDCETCNYCNTNSHLVHVVDSDLWRQTFNTELSLLTVPKK